MNDDSTSKQLRNHITEVATKVGGYWEPNPGLNILTGVNGSGKTKLLDYIYSFMNDGAMINFQFLGTPHGEKIDIKFKNPFIPNGFAISNPVRMQFIPVLWRNYSEQAFSHEIIDKNGMPKQHNHLGPNAISLAPHASLNAKIKIFPDINKYIEKYKEFLVRKLSQIQELRKLPYSNFTVPEVEKEIKAKNPLVEIQTAFDSLPEHINITVKVPDVNELQSTEPQVQFLLKDTSTVIDPESLSSGEKVIIYLLVSEQMGLFGELDVLLLDELDAHLNPALIKVYVEILYRICRTGVQVIVTTHDPIVTNYVEGNDLWWMNKGKVCNKNPDLSEHKRTIVNRLSDGLFSARDIQGIFSLFTDSEKIHDWIFLVEGRHDVITLLTEFIHDLFPEKTFPVVNCKGADNIQYFAAIPYRETGLHKSCKQKIICIFDNDEKGRTARSHLEKKCQSQDGVLQSNKFKNKIYPIFVSDIQNQEMEQVLKCEVQRIKLKERISKLVNAPLFPQGAPTESGSAP